MSRSHDVAYHRRFNFDRCTSTENGLFAFLGGCVCHIFGQIISFRVKELNNSNLIGSRHITVNSIYCGHCRDLELVSSLARVRNSESLFQSNVCNLFSPGIQLLVSVLSECPLQRGVFEARVGCNRKETSLPVEVRCSKKTDHFTYLGN